MKVISNKAHINKDLGYAKNQLSVQKIIKLKEPCGEYQKNPDNSKTLAEVKASITL